MKLWSKLPKFDLSKTEDKLKLFILASGLLIFLVVGSAGAIGFTMRPDFCRTCHVMEPEYQTWKATSHSQIACTDCHIEPGLGNLIVHKVGALKELYHYVTKTYERPLKMAHKIESSVCEQCHSQERVFTTSGDIIIPHAKHREKDVKCVECHSGVAHGKIAQREVTKEGPFEEWTIEVGKKETAKQYTKPDMDTCIRCHTKRNAPRLCETCHSTIFTPKDHSQPIWKTTHGLNARVDLNSCNKCHSYGNTIVSVTTGDKVTQYARGNEFCSKCHVTKPPNHQSPKWLPSHNLVVSAKGKQNCFVCHDIFPPKAENKSTTTYCNKCHWFNAQGNKS